MQILFEGGYYSGVGTIIFTYVMTPALVPSDGVQMHVDFGVDTSCGREVDLQHFFSTRAGISPLVQYTCTSLLHPRELLPWHFSRLLHVTPNIWVGRCRYYNVIEGGYYFIQHRQSCRYYSKADTIRRAGTIWGNTVHAIKPQCSRCKHKKLTVLLHCHQHDESSIPTTVLLTYRSLSNFRGQNIFAGRLMREN